MILKEDLKQYSKIIGFNLGQTETDYLQHLFLLLMSRHLYGELVFKGGTALQKAYGLNRFSVDLDFTQVKEWNSKQAVEKIVSGIAGFGYEANIKEIKTIGKTFVIRINGPLYKESPISASNIRIEISERENVLLNPVIKTITPIYSDLQPYSILVMGLDEVLAEKVRAIMTRNKSKDVFDLHFLLKKGVKFNSDLINKKLAYYKQVYDEGNFIKRLKGIKPLWVTEMRNYVLNAPEFDGILKNIVEAIR